MINTSSHFSSEEWADFARCRMAPERLSRMEQHLERGCKTCLETLQIWNGVLVAAAREEAFKPPETALRCAKALYSAFRPQPARRFSLSIAHMVRFPQTALQGVRGTGPAGHLLFREGPLQLDIQLKTRSDSEAVAMIGQLMDSEHSDRCYGNRPVAVMREEAVLAQTTTNNFGEFLLEFKADEGLLLMIELENTSYLVSHIPVPPKD